MSSYHEEDLDKPAFEPQVETYLPQRVSGLRQEEGFQSRVEALRLITATPERIIQAPPGTPIQTEAPALDTEKCSVTSIEHSTYQKGDKQSPQPPSKLTLKLKPPRRKLVNFKRFYPPRKVFENKGSTARDHLASERTFLAYVRTSLAIASTGVALIQLFTVASKPPNAVSQRVQKFARPLGVTAVLLSLMVLSIGVCPYRTL